MKGDKNAVDGKFIFPDRTDSRGAWIYYECNILVEGAHWNSEYWIEYYSVYNSDLYNADTFHCETTKIRKTSAIFCITLPVGMGIYWIAGAVVRCVQQMIVNWWLDRKENSD